MIERDREREREGETEREREYKKDRELFPIAPTEVREKGLKW